MMLWLLLLCSLCVYWCIQRWRWLRLMSNIPTLPGTLPVIGIAHQILGRTQECLWTAMENWSSDCNALGGAVKVWFGPFLVIGVTDVDLGFSILSTYLQRHYFYSFAEPWLGDGLAITSKVTKWKRLRKLLSPAFPQHAINEFLPIFNEQSELLVKAMKEKAGKGEFDPSQLIAEKTLETIFQTAIGVPLGFETDATQDYLHSMSKGLNVAIKRALHVWLYPNFIYNLTSAKKVETEQGEIFKNMSAKAIAVSSNLKKRRLLKYNSQIKTDTSHRTKSLLKLLLELNEKGELSETEIRDEIDAMIAVGYDTTSTTLQIFLVILGSHPDVQDRLYNEIKTAIPKSGEGITKAELSKLVYLEAAIKETLRLYPTLPFVLRQSDKTLKFGLWTAMESWSSDCNALGGAVKVWFGPFLVINVTDVDLGFSILSNYLQRHYFYSFVEPWLGDGLAITSKVTKWKRLRKSLSPAFPQHVINEFLPIFNEQSELLVKAMKEKSGKGEFDPSQVIAEKTLETIFQTAIGVPLGFETDATQDYLHSISKGLKLMIKRALHVWLYPNCIYNITSAKKVYTEQGEIFKNMSTKAIAESSNLKKTRLLKYNSHINTDTSHRTQSLLKLLLELNERGELSETEIKDEIDAMIAIGYDTTSTTLQIFLVILGSYPDVQDRVYNEIKTAIPKLGEGITKEELSKLVYLEAAIKETLRLYPTLPFVLRQSDKTLKFGDLIIPDGTGICVSLYGVNRNEKYWGSDANEFKPERWLHPSTRPDHSAAFTSFGLGRRNCIGKSYAMMSLKTSVAHIVRQYRVTADHTKLQFKFEFTLVPASGNFISVQQRYE